MRLDFWRKQTPHQILKEEFMDPSSETHKEFEDAIKKIQLIENLIQNEKNIVQSFRTKLTYTENDKRTIISEFENYRQRNNINFLILTREHIKNLHDRLEYELNYLEKGLDKEWPSKELHNIIKDTKRLRNNLNAICVNLKKKKNTQIFVFVDSHDFDPRTEQINMSEIFEFADRLHKGLRNFEKEENEIENHLKKIIRTRLPEAIKKCRNSGRMILEFTKKEKTLDEVQKSVNELIDYMDSIIIEIRKSLSEDMVTKLEVFIERSKKALEMARNKEDKFIAHLQAAKDQLKS